MFINKFEVITNFAATRGFCRITFSSRGGNFVTWDISNVSIVYSRRRVVCTVWPHHHPSLRTIISLSSLKIRF